MGITLRGASGLEVRFLSVGGCVTEINVPDRAGALANVVLSLPTDEHYLEPHPYFGALVGRFSGRIGGACFTLDGEEHQLSRNSGPHHIAGGFAGFDKKLWAVDHIDASSALLRLDSPHGEEGFPGNLSVEVRYSVTEGNGFRIDYEATTDRPTVLNLTNHSYFNLGGEGSGSVEDHIVQIASDQVIETDPELIATGEMLDVADTPLDFRRPRAIGELIRSSHPFTLYARGYDCSYVLNGGPGLREVARAYHPASGRLMTVQTTEPSLAFYSGNFLDGSIVGRSGRQYRQGDAFTLEPRHLPNSPNHDHFPTTVLRPGEKYRATTIYSFETSREGFQ